MAAGVSAVSAWINSRTTKTNLRMQQVDFEERHDSIRPYLIDGVSWNTPDGERVTSFACSYTNAANTPNTLIRFELIVDILANDGMRTSVVLDPFLEAIPSLHNIQRLAVPLNLPARSTASGWISFKLPRHLLGGKRLDKYQITAITSAGKALTLESYLLHQWDNENLKT